MRHLSILVALSQVDPYILSSFRRFLFSLNSQGSTIQPTPDPSLLRLSDPCVLLSEAQVC